MRRYFGLRTGSARRARARQRQCFCLQRSIGRALHSKSVRSTARFGTCGLPLQGVTPLRFEVLASCSLCRTSRVNRDISGSLFPFGFLLGHAFWACFFSLLRLGSALTLAIPVFSP
ncbi:hypothetical protein NDU88_005907 [Pleurodeles waltl]|uniref:Uncharacterized protein n=1 Tax=Pleurodeles waltl TaxID=8319 RepID=A0AAV7RNT6_PLEWA|nr:hypothetical protein NDU88_005907 [Pleurodeles waltl]